MSFSKDDLKDGMIVEYKNGYTRVVKDENLYDKNGISCNNLRYYNDDLTAKNRDLDELDICKVFLENSNVNLLEDDMAKMMNEKNTFKVEEIETMIADTRDWLRAVAQMIKDVLKNNTFSATHMLEIKKEYREHEIILAGLIELKKKVKSENNKGEQVYETV